MTSAFLSGGSGLKLSTLQNGSSALYLQSMSASNLTPSQFVKTDANRKLVSGSITTSDLPAITNLTISGILTANSLNISGLSNGYLSISSNVVSSNSSISQSSITNLVSDLSTITTGISTNLSSINAINPKIQYISAGLSITTIDSDIVPNANLTRNIGSALLKYNNIYCGTNYADNITFGTNSGFLKATSGIISATTISQSDITNLTTDISTLYSKTISLYPGPGFDSYQVTSIYPQVNNAVDLGDSVNGYRAIYGAFLNIISNTISSKSGSITLTPATNVVISTLGTGFLKSTSGTITSVSIAQSDVTNLTTDISALQTKTANLAMSSTDLTCSTNLLPSINATYSLGSVGLNWKTVWISDELRTTNINSGSGFNLKSGGALRWNVGLVNTTYANIEVANNNTYDLGLSDSMRFRKLYVNDISVSNQITSGTVIETGYGVVSSTPTNVLVTWATVFVLTSSSAKTLNLPLVSAVKTNQKFLFKDVSGQASIYNITIAATGGNLIDGSASFVIDSNYGSISLISDGSNWFIY